MRRRALPTIKSKESALRSEVRRAKDMAEEYEEQLKEVLSRWDYMSELWCDFDMNLLRVKDVELTEGTIAGVKIPILGNIEFEVGEWDAFSSPSWWKEGIELLQRIARLGIESEVYIRKAEVLDRARKKTTQKVNLYEKVQIPGYEEAIHKIRRFMEDEENLSKSAQKIVKKRHENSD